MTSPYSTISFPGLGLSMNPPQGFSIGPLYLNIYGIRLPHFRHGGKFSETQQFPDALRRRPFGTHQRIAAQQQQQRGGRRRQQAPERPEPGFRSRRAVVCAVAVIHHSKVRRGPARP